MDVYRELAERLLQVEAELRAMQLWELDSPPAEAMASIEPFALDQLRFSQWLQFVFIPRLQLSCDNRDSLPESCSVAPMAEEFYRINLIDAEAVINQLASIDHLITSA